MSQAFPPWFPLSPTIKVTSMNFFFEREGLELKFTTEKAIRLYQFNYSIQMLTNHIKEKHFSRYERKSVIK